jgi:hypothetical protein
VERPLSAGSLGAGPRAVRPGLMVPGHRRGAPPGLYPGGGRRAVLPFPAGGPDARVSGPPAARRRRQPVLRRRRWSRPAASSTGKGGSGATIGSWRL